MIVGAGWSAETASSAWRKARVDLDDADLAALAREFGFAVEPLTTTQRFALLTAEASWFLINHIMTHYNAAFAGSPDYQAEYQAAGQARNVAITSVQRAQGLIQ